MRDNKNPKTRLDDVVKSADLILLYLEGLSEDEFFNSSEKQDAVIRRLGIIGEAVKNLPEKFKGEYPEIAWHKAAGMRNILVHEYFEVDEEVVWDTLTAHLPQFKRQVEEILKDTGK
jgi:uncharacterized protein with HEPN domain